MIFPNKWASLMMRALTRGNRHEGHSLPELTEIVDVTQLVFVIHSCNDFVYVLGQDF